ncbi:PIN domain-containing protein [Streptomyces erythrochromogenes]|uniref:PIN domain-containing protein n=1 Tax=Streptomyces erythrochromogenes TaxID=285574 RepID=UPI003702D81E
MIIFDTNAVTRLSLTGPTADIIRKLQKSGHHRVAVPWMVLEEIAAHQAKSYPDKYSAAVKALEALRGAVTWELQSSLERLDLDRLMNHWRDAYTEIFEVIETSPEAMRKALTREALALPPAKRAKDHSEGARDVAIWLSILEFLKANPKEDVCFVTANTKDFGDGITYPYPMNEDVEGLANRLTRLKDFNAVISAFTKTVSGTAAEATAKELLQAPNARTRVAQAALETHQAAAGFAGLDAKDTTVRWNRWLIAPEAELLTVTEVTGHEIGADVWYTAKARWLLCGLAVNREPANFDITASVWEAKVLFSTRNGETPTLLASHAPEAPDTTDPALAELLSHLKQRANEKIGQTLQGSLEVISLWLTSINRDQVAFERKLRNGLLTLNWAPATTPERDAAGWHTFASALLHAAAAGGEPLVVPGDSGDNEAVKTDENQLSFDDADTADGAAGNGDGADPEAPGDQAP